MLDIDPAVVAWLAIASVVLSAALLAVVIILSMRLTSLRRDHQRAFAGVDDDLLVAVGRHAEQLGLLRGDLGELRADAGHLRDLLRRTVSRVGVLRYDAFDDMGGALSFSAALLDEHGDGMVISAINGRTETRCYAKPIAAGESEHSLSVEEVEAVSSAMEGRPASTSRVAGPRRRRRSAS